jgi:hypothetical protein
LRRAAHDGFLELVLGSSRHRPHIRKTAPLGKGGGALSLEEKLAAVRAATPKRVPAKRLAIMHDATERLRRSGILDRVIKPGTKAPDFTLNDQNGDPVTLSALLSRGPVLMSVFRGFW